MISAHPEWNSYKEAPIKGNKFKRWLKSRFRFVDYPFLMAYRGFGNDKKLYVQGHVFKGMALNKPSKKFSVWRNFKVLLKMFMLRTVQGATVELRLNENVYNQKTTDDGFFQFEIDDHNLPDGWQNIKLRLKDELVEGQASVELNAEALIRSHFETGVITDVDDTFLVSHATNKFKKLRTLITKNAETRRAFKGVAEFYHLLQSGTSNSQNPFFYVSSSEWNLYDFLIEFIEINKLPKGILQLKNIKDGLLEFFKSGYGSHEHKAAKIENILSLYPESKFVLIGDNGQHDPFIYSRIAGDYKDRIKAVYIRGVSRSNRKKTDVIISEIESMGIPACQFKQSADAQKHALENGILKTA